MRSRLRPRLPAPLPSLALTLAFATALLPQALAEGVAPAVIEAQQQRVAAIDRAARTAVAIFAGEAGGGSGVLISPDGYALTNFHVVQPAGVAMKCGLSDGRLYDAVLVGLDPTGDVALIKLVGRDDFPSAEFADSDLVAVGDFCFAAGNPFLLASDFQPSISAGIVSGTHRYQFPAGTILEYSDCLQVDAAINPGNSGGPLLDSAGRLVGVNTQIASPSGASAGIGFAIPADEVSRIVPRLIRDGRYVRPAIGVTAGPPGLLRALNLTSAPKGVALVEVAAKGPAARAGLQPFRRAANGDIVAGDVITAINDEPVADLDDMLSALERRQPGDSVTLTVWRNGQARKQAVVLGGGE